jgi:23S rRNA pseudouridine1911/1915/1917 synthase
MEEIEISSRIEDRGIRLDKFLFEKLKESQPGISRTRVKALVDSGNVKNATLDKVINSCSGKIKGEEKFIVIIPPLEESEIIAQDIHFDILFEDDHMLVIDKPAGLITHPGNGRHDKTLVNALLFKIGDSLSGINGVMRPGIVHRLDKDTSGLMVVAKNDLAHKNLASQIEDRSLKRNYLALCYGVPKPLSGRINKNIDRSHKNRLKMTIVKSSGKRAVTNYDVKEVYLDGAVSLVECRLDTGRTHQIRVHMDEIGHPLVGDNLYKSKRKYLGELDEELQNCINHFPRQFLHSYKIAFSHPVSKKEMEFEIPLPKDLEDLKLKLFS